MAKELGALVAIFAGAALAHLIWIVLPLVIRARPKGDLEKGQEISEEEEISRELNGTQAQAWLAASHLGLWPNVALAGLCLMLSAADGDPSLAFAALPCGAAWSFCALYLLLAGGGRRVTPRPEDSRSAGPATLGPSLRYLRLPAYTALMALLTACGPIRPGPTQGTLLGVQRVLFSIASLSPVETAVFGLIASGARLAACHYVDGSDGACGRAEDVIITEACFVFGSVLATYAAREMRKVSVKLLLECRRAQVQAAYSRDSSEDCREDSTALGETVALYSMLHAACDAVVTLDAGLAVSGPAWGLAMMLGVAEKSSLQGMFLKVLLASEDAEGAENTRFLEALVDLESSRSPVVAPCAMISMATTQGDLVRMQCMFTKIAAVGSAEYAGSKAPAFGSAAPAYVLGLREIVSEFSNHCSEAPMAPIAEHLQEAPEQLASGGSAVEKKRQQKRQTERHGGVVQQQDRPGCTSTFRRTSSPIVGLGGVGPTRWSSKPFHPVSPPLKTVPTLFASESSAISVPRLFVSQNSAISATSRSLQLDNKRPFQSECFNLARLTGVSALGHPGPRHTPPPQALGAYAFAPGGADRTRPKPSGSMGGHAALWTRKTTPTPSRPLGSQPRVSDRSKGSQAYASTQIPSGRTMSLEDVLRIAREALDRNDEDDPAELGEP